MSTRARAVAPLHEGGEHADELSRLGAHDGRTEYPLARGVERILRKPESSSIRARARALTSGCTSCGEVALVDPCAREEFTAQYAP
jgi:hypothetical protein